MKFQKIISLAKQLLPWIAAAAILLFLFWRIDIKQFLNALFEANLYLYLPAVIVFILGAFLLDAQNIKAILHHFSYEVPYKQVLGIRGITYLLMTINWTVGMGGMAYYLKQVGGIPLMRSTALIFFFNAITQITMFLMAGIGCLLVSEPSVIVNKMFIVCIVGLGAYIIFISILKILPSWKILKKIKNMALLKVFHEASVKSYFLLTFWRVLYYLAFIAFYYAGVKAFHMDIPLIELLTSVPIILLVISLPITPMGLGTSQAAMILLFKDFGSEPNILAFSIVYLVSVQLLRSIIGLCYIKKFAGLAPIKRLSLKTKESN